MRPTSRINLCLVVAALSLASVAVPLPAAQAQNNEPARIGVPPERIDALRERLGKVCGELGLPGLAVAVVVDDKVVLVEGFGERDLEAKLPVDVDTRFMIGSTTKAFTSALIATLVDAGVLHWDDRLSKLLPGFSMFDDEAAAECTLRDLLSHRSGLMRTDMTWYAGTADFPALLAAFGRAEPTGKFRSLWQYNNNGFLMAGVASATAEAKASAPATTARWGELLRERILAPLGMSRTTSMQAQVLDDGDRAIGYEHVAGGEPKPAKPPMRRARLRDLSNIAPAGAIWSTATDMSRWLRFQLARGKIGDRRVISQERIEEMWAPQIALGGPVDPAKAADDRGTAYGMGWMVSKRRGTRLIAHDGGIDGFTTNVALLPDLGIGYAAMTNLGSASIAAVMPVIVFGTLLGENEEPMASNAEDFAAYLGKYRADMLRSEFTVLVKDGRLAVDVPGQTVYELRPPDADGKRVFALTDEISVRFERDAAGQVNRMRMFQMGLEFELPKLGATFVPEVTDAELAELGGLYHDPRLGKNVSIQRTPEGRLAMDVPGQMIFELQRADEQTNEKDRWNFRLLPRTWIVFVRNDEGKVVGATAFQNGTRGEMPRVAEGPQGDASPDATALAELLKRHDEAHGFEALRKAGTVRVTGTANFVNQGVSGPFTALVDGADRSAARIDFPPFGWVRTARRSAGGETESAFDGGHALDAKELELSRLVSGLPLVTIDRSALKSVELVGFEGAGEIRLAKLRLVAPGGAEATLFLDERTGLARRLDGSTQVPGVGLVPIALAFDDYREIAGMKLPFRMVTDSPAFGRLVQTIDSVEPGVTVAETEWTIAKP